MKQLYIYILSLLFFSLGTTSKAQDLSVVNVAALLDDNTARISPRYDLNDNICALVRVVIPTVKGLEIKGRLGVVDSLYKQGEYLVYVPEGTKVITYHHSEYHSGEIIFADYGLKKGLKGGSVYSVTLEAPTQKQTASVILNVSPSSASVESEGKACPVDEGITSVECYPGLYKFLVSAPDYQNQEIEVSVDNDLFPRYVRVNLQKQTTLFTVDCNVQNAEVYVDGTNYGLVGTKMIPVGKHNIRVSARGYEDCILEKDFEFGQNTYHEFVLKRASRTVKIRLNGVDDSGRPVKSIDYRPIKRNTTEVELKPRKHKFNGKTINVTMDMDGMTSTQIMKLSKKQR